MLKVMVLSAFCLGQNSKPPAQPTPIQAAATKQFDIDRTNLVNYQPKYYAFVNQMYSVNQGVFDLGKMLRTQINSPDYDALKCALIRASDDAAKGQKMLSKADFAVNTMGAQLLNVEKSAFLFGDYEVALFIGQLSKQYWDCGSLNLSGASALLNDAQTQLDLAKKILLGPSPDIQGPGAPDATPPIVGPPDAPP